MSAPRFSKRVFASYVSDWIVVVIFCVIAYIFNRLRPQHHDFSLLDLTISYPLRDDTVPFWVAGVVAGVVPAVAIPVIIFACVPGRVARRAATSKRVLQLKLWELNAGWLGLALSLLLATVATTGLKKFGKPRPNMLARCLPDVDAVTQNYAGGDGKSFSPLWMLVTFDICTQTDQSVLDDGFQSWPSGHSSFSWAGLLYFSLFLAAKFSIKIPSIPFLRAFGGAGAAAGSGSSRPETTNSHHEARPMLTPGLEGPAYDDDAPIQWRDEAAAAPLYLLVVFLIPISGAAYIAVSRWMDFAHHGFDVFSGSLLGILSAWFAFRWYHPALSAGSGWAWGPRSAARAFEIGVGIDGYVEPRAKEVFANGGRDLELGRLRPE